MKKLGMNRSKLLAAMAVAACVAAAQAGEVTITIDGETSYQTIEGFGASHVSLVREAGDLLGPVLRAQALDAIYNQVKLTTGNLETPILETPAGFAERTNDDGDPFNYNWPGFSFAAADAMVQYVLDPAGSGFGNHYLGTKIREIRDSHQLNGRNIGDCP